MATAEGRHAAFQSILLAGWPIRNIATFIKPPLPEIPPDEAGSFSGGKLRPFPNQLADWVGGQFINMPKIAIAALAWRYTVDLEAAAAGYDFGPGGWATRIILRDLLLMVAVAGLWDYLLYFSPL